MNQYLSIIRAVNYALFCLLILSLPFPWRVANYVIIAWFVTWLLEFRWCYRVREHLAMHPMRERWPSILLAVWVLWECATLLWTTDTQATHLLIERHLTLLALPLVAFFGVNDHYNSRRFFTLWVQASLISIPFYIFGSIIAHNSWQIYYDVNFDNFQWPPVLLTNLTGVIKHRLFYCMVLTLGLCSLPYLYRAYEDRYPRAARMATLGIAALGMIGAIVLTNSRAIWLLLLLLPLVYAAYTFRGRVRRIIIACGIVLAVGVGALLVHYAPRFDQMQSDPRITEWSTFLRHYDDYTLLGTGAGTSQDHMVAYYIEEGGSFEEGIRERYGTHNQYFNQLMTMGPLSLVYLVAVFVVLVWAFRGHARWWALSVALIWLINMLSDDILERIDPILTLATALVICLVLAREDQRRLAR